MKRETSPEHALQDALVEAFAHLGGSVRLFPDARNLVRPREEGDGVQPVAVPDSVQASHSFVIEVQGVPNLLHELGHAVLVGRLERDHGTDFAAIPFSLDSEEGRRLLFEELSCCVLSCRWHPGDLEQAHEWFDEQVGIQSLFFGAERDPEAFLARIDQWILSRDQDLDQTLRRAELELRRALDATRAGPGRFRPRHPLDICDWWARFRVPVDPSSPDLNDG